MQKDHLGVIVYTLSREYIVNLKYFSKKEISDFINSELLEGSRELIFHYFYATESLIFKRGWI